MLGIMFIFLLIASRAFNTYTVPLLLELMFEHFGRLFGIERTPVLGLRAILICPYVATVLCVFFFRIFSAIRKETRFLCDFQ